MNTPTPSDRFGIANWDRWTFAQTLKATKCRNVSANPNTLQIAADVAFFNSEYEHAAELYSQLYLDYPDNLDINLRILHCLDAQCVWNLRESLISTILNQIKNQNKITLEPLCYLSVPLTSMEFNQLAKGRASLLNLRENRSIPINKPISKNSKIRIGYLSIDFRSHSCGVPIWPIIQNHNRSQFDIYTFSISSDPALETTIQNSNNLHFNISNLTWIKAQRLILDAKLDILIDTTRHIRGAPTPIFSRRLARTQISGWGYGDTSGIPSMDALLGDAVTLMNKEQKYYEEDLIELPSYLPITIQKVVKTGPKEEFAALNIPSKSSVFGCFVNHYKINQDIFVVWLKILMKVPDSILVLTEGNAQSRAHISLFTKKLGIDPIRIRYWSRIKQDAHIKRLGLIDIILDNPNLGGSASVLDGLSTGTPCVSIQQNTPGKNGATSLLRALNLNDFIAHSWDDYENKAVNLANNTTLFESARAAIKKAIERKNPAYIDNFVAGLEMSLLNFISSQRYHPETE